MPFLFLSQKESPVIQNHYCRGEKATNYRRKIASHTANILTVDDTAICCFTFATYEITASLSHDYSHCPAIDFIASVNICSAKFLKKTEKSNENSECH